MVENFDREWVRLANGFGGGIAGVGDVCGAVIGSVMVIGALYGRKDLTEDQTTCWRLSEEFQRRFLAFFSSTNCQFIKDAKPGGWTHEKCAETVKIALQILFEILAGEGNSPGKIEICKKRCPTSSWRKGQSTR